MVPRKSWCVKVTQYQCSQFYSSNIALFTLSHIHIHLETILFIPSLWLACLHSSTLQSEQSTVYIKAINWGDFIKIAQNNPRSGWLAIGQTFWFGSLDTFQNQYMQECNHEINHTVSVLYINMELYSKYWTWKKLHHEKIYGLTLFSHYFMETVWSECMNPGKIVNERIQMTLWKKIP